MGENIYNLDWICVYIAISKTCDGQAAHFLSIVSFGINLLHIIAKLTQIWSFYFRHMTTCLLSTLMKDYKVYFNVHIIYTYNSPCLSLCYFLSHTPPILWTEPNYQSICVRSLCNCSIKFHQKKFRTKKKFQSFAKVFRQKKQKVSKTIGKIHKKKIGPNNKFSSKN